MSPILSKFVQSMTKVNKQCQTMDFFVKGGCTIWLVKMSTVLEVFPICAVGGIESNLHLVQHS